MELDRLKFEIEKVNTLKTVALTEITRLHAELSTFVGQKIRLASGDYSKKFNPKVSRLEMKDTNNKYTFSGYLEGTTHSIYVNLKIWMPIPSGVRAESQYKNITIYLGIMDKGTFLVSMNPLETIIFDYGLNVPLDYQTELTKIRAFKESEMETDRLKKLIKVDAEVYKYF